MTAETFTNDEKREIALRLATQGHQPSSSPSEIVQRAQAYYEFLDSGTVTQSDEPNPEPDSG